MKGSLFSIGIDLGTTNSALAFTAVDDEYATSQIFEISQWETATSQSTRNTLPSFLYLPAAAARATGGDARSSRWMVGQYARRQASDLPGRVAHSAKSWLCLHSVDRSAPFLPWASAELGEDEKISPVHASALILSAFRDAWDQAHEELGSQGRFEAQQVTITVPASFDSAAQKLTLEAAAMAGFPTNVQLVEEPQAVFYRWLERHPSRGELQKRLPQIGKRPHHVLIVDIGGGTSDFSIFRIGGEEESSEDAAAPHIDRVAVSEHILLGGDNVDLALAHLVECRLAEAAGDGAAGDGAAGDGAAGDGAAGDGAAGDGAAGDGAAGGGAAADLSSGQRHFLVARCRDLKERILVGVEGEAAQTDGADPQEAFSISVPGRGSGLLAGTLTAQIRRSELDGILLDGFFPLCSADVVPARNEGALKEWGLPYAADSAVTHHLADFLRDQPAVDAILFNGGTLYPAPLRHRLTEAITAWQDGKAPVTLNNPEPDLAVARGAARYGWLTHRKQTRIGAGAASALYLEVQGGQHDGPPPLVCVLPHGTEPEHEIVARREGLRLRVGQPVRFRAHYSTRRKKDAPGALVTLEGGGKFHPLPPLETIATLPKGVDKPEGGLIPIHLSARLNAIGLLQVACVSDAPGIDHAWPLEFNLRHQKGDRLQQTAQTRAAAPSGAHDHLAEDIDITPTGDPGVSPEDFAEAQVVLGKVFDPERTPQSVTPARLFKELAKVLGIQKHEWNWVLLRSLWPLVEAGKDGRAISIDHEETWLTLAGYLLRPGYGADFDPQRMEALWKIHLGGLVNPGKRIRLQEQLMWRRVAGGLDRDRQTTLLQQVLPTLRQASKPSAELVRMTGALERVGQSFKKELIEKYLERAVILAKEGGYADPYFVALGLLLNRAPLYAGPEAVVSPDLVEEAYAATRGLDWKSLPELQTLFMRAVRVIDNPHLDLPESRRKKIAAKLEKAGVSPVRTLRLKQFEPIEQADAVSLFGESLPPGLVLG